MPTLMIDGTPLIVRRARVEEIIDLRHAVLRHGLPRSEAVFDGDGAETSRHYAGLSGSPDAGGGVVGCATLHAVPWLGEAAWQLRGMATAPGFRGRGVGRELMALIESDLLDARPPLPLLLWCNARVPAVGFYHRQGWHVVSEQFDIPTAGPHFRMVKRLTAPGEARGEPRRALEVSPGRGLTYVSREGGLSRPNVERNELTFLPRTIHIGRLPHSCGFHSVQMIQETMFTRCSQLDRSLPAQSRVRRGLLRSGDRGAATG